MSRRADLIERERIMLLAADRADLVAAAKHAERAHRLTGAVRPLRLEAVSPPPVGHGRSFDKEDTA